MSTELKIENIYSQLITDDKELKEFLHTKLRFRPKNFWHSSAYKKKIWDGWKSFYDIKTGRFMTGLLPEVRQVIKKFNKTPQVIDCREKVKWLYESIDDSFLNQFRPENPIKLHDYQPDLVNQCLKYDRGIIQAPTGAGKTFCLVSLLKSLPPKTPTLFITKNSSLVHQNFLEMQEWGIENLGRWYGNYKELNYIMCVTSHIKTFESLEKLLSKFKVLLVDEIHDCMSEVPLAAYKKMSRAYIRVGFSATPFKWNKKKIDDVHKWTVKGNFGPVFKTTTTESGLLTTKDLQDRGILSKSRCYFHPVIHPDLKYEPYQDAVKLGIEQNFHFHKMVVDLAKTLPGRTLIIVERIEQGEYLSQLIPDAFWIQGKNNLKERQPVINSLKEDEKCIAIIMRPIITAGINIRCHNLINAAGGESAHNVIQQMGRGLRTARDKEGLEYHDFLFKINEYLEKHSLWRMSVLANEGHSVSQMDS
jgi:superfamily II DNA or RNA helicase